MGIVVEEFEFVQRLDISIVWLMETLCECGRWTSIQFIADIALLKKKLDERAVVIRELVDAALVKI